MYYPSPLILLHIFVSSVAVSALTFPLCYDECLDSLLATTPCALNDNSCFCTNQNFLQKMGDCLCQGCSTSDLETSAQLAIQTCSQVGVNLQLTSCPGLSSPDSDVTPTAVPHTTVGSSKSAPTRVLSSRAPGMTGIGSAFIVAAVTAATLAVLTF